MWMNLENMVSERNQTQDHVLHGNLCKLSRVDKSIRTKYRWLVARHRGQRIWKNYLKWEWQKCFGTIVMVAQHCQSPKSTKSFTLKWFILQHVNFTSKSDLKKSNTCYQALYKKSHLQPIFFKGSKYICQWIFPHYMLFAYMTIVSALWGILCNPST